MSRMPQVTSRELLRFLKTRGVVKDRQSGSHLTLWHEGRKVSITIPIHKGCDIGRGLALRILRDSGFSVDEFLEGR